MSGFDGCTVRSQNFQFFQTLPLRGSFPKIRGTFLGAPIMKIIVFGGLYWGPLIALKFARVLGFRVWGSEQAARYCPASLNIIVPRK